MKRNVILLGLALATISTACNQGGKKDGKDSAVSTLTPAKPEGTISVALENRDQDTGQVRINFQIGNARVEEVFDVDLLQQGADTAIYRVVWDKPNSAYVGVIKSNKDTRYYHALTDSPFVRIRWSAAPPKDIWQYVEGPLGLGAFLKNQPLVKEHNKNFRSGQLVEDFIVKVEQAGADSVKLHYKYGGIEEVDTYYIPASVAEAWLTVAQDDLVYFGLKMNGEFKEAKQLRVRNGRLETKTLRKIKFK
ncbi:hypothetical protein MKQ68_15650 [Chitinophaga horti]|uniref:DUF3108 domain-containing protein n=1 Tax=Chitinophaga horti TaxID=2920382 RepID=A0ABY6IW57_9BACT|nr:hypothetical protein [Chitinophaga horti]UYQ91525.1 hypothetical protein MKQ68_15650 [Chitinophaga horti]